jgi:hypothetical protein
MIKTLNWMLILPELPAKFKENQRKYFHSKQFGIIKYWGTYRMREEMADWRYAIRVQIINDAAGQKTALIDFGSPSANDTRIVSEK